MMKRDWLLLVLLLLILASSAFAQGDTPYHLKLLAVYEDEETYHGSDADLYLELKKGTGRIFLETFPLTKLDTQISTRFAKDIACSHFKMDCSQYDFIYTIKAKSSIIGGPSAGAAITALTTIAVLDLEYDEDIAITGTINSGGIIGLVGGVKEKLEAAAEAGIDKILVSRGTMLSEVVGNNTIKVSPVDFGRENLSLEVKEVLNIDEVIFQLTGVDLNNKEIVVTEDDQYTEIMKRLQETLCNRTKKIEQELEQENVALSDFVINDTRMKKEYAFNATRDGDYYSAASYCFGTNIQLKEQYYQEKKPAIGKLHQLFNALDRKIEALENKINQEKIETIADLQTLIVVKERLNDVHKQIESFRENPSEQSLEKSYYLLAYAEERFFSAVSWMQFFSMDGKKFILDKETLSKFCLQKISEAEERQQYIAFFLDPSFINGINDKISTAKMASEDDETALCLIKASQAKADANALLTSLGLNNESILNVFQAKLTAVERVISENSAEGIFPILGYSYYQYAKSLRDTEQYTALLYLEYALDMSELGMYFPEEQTFRQSISRTLHPYKDWLARLGSFLAGVVLTLIIYYVFKKKVHKKKTNSKK